MPNWNDVLREIETTKSEHPLDIVRRKYLRSLSEYTSRPTIAYYSGWLGRSSNPFSASINDEDKNAFMTTVHGLDRSKGLDLILHTPGGDLAAAESIVHYLKNMFGNNIRAIIPQLAMSAGTMIACACQSIVMGKQSNLGPIDPQVNGLPAQGVIEEFKNAVDEVKGNPDALPLWQSIIGKYHPTFLGECQKAMDWSERLVENWLISGMFENSENSASKAKEIVSKLSDHQETKNHSRHIHIEDCIEMGLVIEKMEDDDRLQDLVLTTHHAFMHTFGATKVFKIVENQSGIALIRQEGTT